MQVALGEQQPVISGVLDHASAFSLACRTFHLKRLLREANRTRGSAAAERRGPMIINPEGHDIDRAGKRLLRDVLEPLKWVLNEVQEDYGIDCNVQVFDGPQPTGAWFHVQLKSSASSAYSANAGFVSQELRVDRARHYALEMRDPVFLIHADVSAKRLYWHAPQLDNHLASVLAATHSQFITVRVPTRQRLPETAPELLTNLNDIYLALGSRA
jgi:hypothetical protein